MRHILSDQGDGDSPNGGLRWRAPKARARLRIPIPSRGWHRRSQDRLIGGSVTAEPFLRRAVPVLIVAFLLTLGIAAVRRCARAAAPGGRQIGRRARPDRDRDRRAPRPAGRERTGDAVDARLPRLRARSTGRRAPRPAASSCSPTRRHDHRDAAGAERLRRPQAQRGDRPRSADATPSACRAGVSEIALADGIAHPARAARHQRAARPARHHAGRAVVLAAGAPTPRSPSRCSPRPASCC